MKRPLRLLMVADDPDTILSYGLLSQMLIDYWKKYYEIHYLSLQYPFGKPLQRENYIKYPAYNQGERNPTNLPNLMNQLQPDIIWTNFDVQHYENVKKFLPPGASWVGWIPWDNHDVQQAQRAQSAFQHVDIRIAISKFGMEFLKNSGVRMDDYIYNIVDTKYFKPLPPEDPGVKNFLQHNKWYKPEEKLLLFVGRPNWRKRIPHIFGIVKDLMMRGHKDFKLFLHTNLDDPGKTADLREIMMAMGIQDHIINSAFDYTVGISKEDLNIIYNLADLYIAPHGGEGFGMPIAEAMAAGTPFIASDICTTKEFGGDKERGLAAPVVYPMDHRGQLRPDRGVARPYVDIPKFCDLVEGIWNDSKRLKKMGENGTKWVNENCTLELVGEKWKNVLDTYDIPIIGIEGYK